MADEEMAEEYRKDLKSKFFLSEPQLDLACQGYKDGFLAGLKAGRQPIEEAVEIIRELGGIVREGVTCHHLTDCEIILHRAIIFLKEAAK